METYLFFFLAYYGSQASSMLCGELEIDFALDGDVEVESCP